MTPMMTASVRCPRKNDAVAVTTSSRSSGLRTIVPTIAGEPATPTATTAVTPRPTHIHPYTPRRNAVTRSAAAAGEPARSSGLAS
jgi:hypothetical protein